MATKYVKAIDCADKISEVFGIPLHDLVDVFAEIPSADVAEVKHGEWVWVVETHGDPMYGVDEDFGYQCSECHMWADEWGVESDIYEEPPTRLHYCPNCGAKMDGERKENE
jgi:hypothetical protein